MEVKIEGRGSFGESEKLGFLKEIEEYRLKYSWSKFDFFEYEWRCRSQR